MTDKVTTEELQRQVRNLLDELATERLADGVADRLRARQIKGKRADSCGCPIANLIKTLPGVEEVDVMGPAVLVWGKGLPGSFVVALPEVVRGFILNFDTGIYLDLVEMAEVAS